MICDILMRALAPAPDLVFPWSDACSAHASPMTTQRYAHLADDPLRRASEAIGDSLMRALEANGSRLRELPDKVEVALDSSLPLAGAEAG
jgi:hypothetical protein